MHKILTWCRVSRNNLLPEYKGLVCLSLLPGGSQCLHIPGRITFEMGCVRVRVLGAGSATSVAAAAFSLSTAGGFRFDSRTHLLWLIYLLLMLLAFDLRCQTCFRWRNILISNECLVLCLSQTLSVSLILQNIWLVVLAHPVLNLRIAHTRMTLLKLDFLSLVFLEDSLTLWMVVFLSLILLCLLLNYLEILIHRTIILVPIYAAILLIILIWLCIIIGCCRFTLRVIIWDDILASPRAPSPNRFFLRS